LNLDHHLKFRRLTTYSNNTSQPRQVPKNHKTPLTEQKSDREPTRVIDPARRRYPCGSVEQHGDVDVSEPGLGVLALPEPKRNGDQRAKDEGVELWVVSRAFAKLAFWTDEAPVMCGVNRSRFG
jgi:hypothetical protein